MRSIAPLVVLNLLHTALAAFADLTPFYDPLFGLANNEILVKRQNCQSGYNSCADLGAESACCPPGTNCALDDAGRIACCPPNALCTGTIAGTLIGTVTTTSSSSGGFVLGGTTTSSTTSTDFSTTPSLTTGVSGGGSTVPNNYYPFIYIPTTYANADLCTSAYSSCQTASTSCFVSLAGANGVTVSGFGGGVTVPGVSGTLLSSASSICSSLSVQGCYNLQESQCSIFGSGSGPTPTTTGGFVEVGNDGPKQTACPGMLYAVGAGAVFGAMGGLV